MSTMGIALFIFLVSYVIIMTEKFNRALVAIGGGLLMIVLGIFDLHTAFVKYIDWNTISLLFSMMILVSITSKTGAFEYVAVHVAKLVKGKPIPLLFMMSMLTALFSAFLDNVTTVLLFVPIILTLTKILELPPIPFLIATILSSNIGGTGTLIGDPPNIMIGQANKELTFNAFLSNLAPIILVIQIVTILILALLYRKTLVVSDENRKKLMEMDPNSYLGDRKMLTKSVTVLGITILGFILHPFIHIELTVVAMLGALVLMFITQKSFHTEKVFEQIEWVTLFFFMGLFMLVGGLEASGIIGKIAEGIMTATGGDITTTAMLILWVSGLLSGFVDNIPFVAAMIPVIQDFQSMGLHNVEPLWWALSLGACLGGNATLIGASANVVVSGLADKAHHPIRFMSYMKIGFPMAILSLIISTIYLYLRYLM